MELPRQRTARTLGQLATPRFLLLDPLLPARQARELLWKLQPHHAVIPLDGSGELFSIHSRDLLRLRLSRVEDATPLTHALGLDQETPVPIRSPYEPAWDAPDLCLLVDDGRIEGVFDIDEPGDGPLRSGRGELQTRFLMVENDAAVTLGETTSVLVSLELEPLLGGQHKPVDLPPGCEVHLRLHARRGFAIEGPREGRLTVDDSEEPLPFQFRVRATETGPGRLEVLAFVHGACIAKLILTPSVEEATSRRGGPSLLLRAETLMQPPPENRPDLSLTIREEEGRRGTTTLSFELHSMDPSVAPKRFGPHPVAQDLSPHLVAIFDDFDQSEQVQKDRVREMLREQQGFHLFQELLPPDLQALLWAVRQRVRSVQIFSGEWWIPWELCRMCGPDDQGELQSGEFFCERFAMGRWPVDQPVSSLGEGRIGVVTAKRLAEAENERTGIIEIAEGRPVEVIEPRYDAVVEALCAGDFGVLHFSGHGNVHRDWGDGAWIELDGAPLRPRYVSGLARNLARSRPLVFFNGCHTAHNAEALAGVGGWPSRFLEAGAGGFLGTNWSVRTTAARHFARHVYEKLFTGETIGEAVRQARCRVRDDFPESATWLAYTLYADPLAKLGSAEARAERPAA